MEEAAVDHQEDVDLLADEEDVEVDVMVVVEEEVVEEDEVVGTFQFCS